QAGPGHQGRHIDVGTARIAGHAAHPAHAGTGPPVTPRPPDFEPLAGSDPVPGDPDQVATIARRYRDTAAEIAKQASNLRTLAQQAEGGWKGKAGTVFSSHASDLSDRISKAQGRYAATGDALNGWVQPLTTAQDEVYQAVWDAKAAQQQMT